MLLWLADVLRDAGLHVIEYDGWRTRTRAGGINPKGIVAHHTATPRSASDKAVRKLLAEGRPDLPGPLSQLGLERDGTFVVIAAGRCNHNGYGLWGNDSIGIEAYNDGVGEPWAPAQVDAYQRGCAAICAHLGWDASRIKAHRETDPGRKIDPTGIDMAAFRAAVDDLLTNPPEEDDMADAVVWYDNNGSHAYRVTGNVGKYLPREEDVSLCLYLGVKQANTRDKPLDITWQNAVVLFDGPCRNVASGAGASAPEILNQMSARLAG